MIASVGILSWQDDGTGHIGFMVFPCDIKGKCERMPAEKSVSRTNSLRTRPRSTSTPIRSRRKTQSAGFYTKLAMASGGFPGPKAVTSRLPTLKAEMRKEDSKDQREVWESGGRKKLLPVANTVKVYQQAVTTPKKDTRPCHFLFLLFPLHQGIWVNCASFLSAKEPRLWSLIMTRSFVSAICEDNPCYYSQFINYSSFTYSIFEHKRVENVTLNAEEEPRSHHTSSSSPVLLSPASSANP